MVVHYKNLEWISIKGNINHAHDTGLVKSNGKIKVYDTLTKTTKQYRSMRELGRYLHIPHKDIAHLIVTSQKYPILNRYKLSIDNMEEYLNVIKGNSNVAYVYDFVKQEHKILNSKHAASTLYGVKIRNPRANDFYIGGVYISDKPIPKDKETFVTKGQAMDDRDDEWRTNINSLRILK